MTSRFSSALYNNATKVSAVATLFLLYGYDKEESNETNNETKYSYYRSSISKQTSCCKCDDFLSSKMRAKLSSDLSNFSMKDKYDVDWEAPPLGEGGFSLVYLGKDKESKEKVAVKKIAKRYTEKDSFLNEMRALLHIKAYGGHPHIAGLKEEFEEGDYYYIIQELVNGGEMFDYLVQSSFSESDAARLIREVACAIAFLHGVGMCHGDLKPENLMLSSTKRSGAVVKVVDFGCANVFKDDYDNLVNEFDENESILIERAMHTSKADEGNTPAYSPPEVINGRKKDAATDMWALGVILYIMLTGLHPFDLSAQSTDEQISRRIRNHETPPLRGSPITAHLSKSAIDLIESLIKWNKDERLTAQEMLEHPWVRGETARTSIIADSDTKLSLFRKFRSKLEAKVFANMVSRSNEQDIHKKISLLDQAFQSFDSGDKGFINTDDLKNITGTKVPMKKNISLSLSGFENLLSQHMKNKYFSQGELIYKEGDIGHNMYFINSGVVELENKNGYHQRRGQGDFFGEGALLNPKMQRSSTITALTPVHVISVHREYFEKYLAETTGLKVDITEKDKMRKRARAKAILRLQQNLKQLEFKEGDYLFKVDQEGNELYLLEHGKINVNIEGNFVLSIKEGDLCGESSLIMGRARNCDAICVSPTCKVLGMSSRDFFMVLENASSTKKSLREMCLRRELLKALVKKTHKSFPNFLNLREAFDAGDLDGSGLLSPSNVRELLISLDSNISGEDINELLASLGLDEKNGIDFEEFKKIITN